MAPVRHQPGHTADTVMQRLTSRSSSDSSAVARLSIALLILRGIASGTLRRREVKQLFVCCFPLLHMPRDMQRVCACGSAGTDA